VGALIRLADPARHPLVAGVGLAAVTALVLWLLPRTLSVDVAGLLLMVIAGAYIGTAAAADDGAGLLVEALAALAFLVMVLASRVVGVWLLAAGFVVHAGWDVLHHGRWSGTARTARWYPPFCIVYDLLVAVAVAWQGGLVG